METQNANNSLHSTFGTWFYKQPKVARVRLLQAFEREGINPLTVRNWAHRAHTPVTSSWNAVEKVTGLKIETLFPY